MSTESTPFDVAVIGGSYAGLSAAMQLARARRRILVVDAGLRRNRFAAASHGFLGQDGRAPDAIAAEGKRQLLAYPTVQWLDGEAAQAEPILGGFRVRMQSGDEVRTRQIILATGVVDDLPEIPGLAERWGKHVFHCPYCHGYELGQGRIGVLAISPMALHQAMMLPDWGTVTLFTNEAIELDDAQRETLARRGVVIEPQRVAGIVDVATVQLTDGRRIVMDGLFTASRTRVSSPIAEQLGCQFEEGPIGTYIHTDAFKATSVKGLFACGDAARMAGNVAFAVGDGAQAGAAAHQALLFG
ncbi:thioredoxin reductase [Bordetella sp. J329]|uniref:NAD(P)/FAD-dependent oxidoreductase n=1 Tax=Kerstersia gyiorum TaxID=206506 RepID=UPI000FD8AE15|nr:thioredoxin reductase [Bordetella sp. J329]